MKLIIKNSNYIKDYLKMTDNIILNDIEFSNNTAVILGNFDGVHLGHLEIIKKAIKSARLKGLDVILYTFREFPNKKNSLIYSLSEKLYILNQLDIDYVYLEEFDNIKNFTPEEFVKNILIKNLNVKEIFCGFNYTFGRNKSGNVDILKDIINNQIILNVSNPYVFNFDKNELKSISENEILNYSNKGYILLSSTYIKYLISKGEIEKVNKLLFKEYFFIGKVIHGRKLGRTIGFPTANIEFKIKTIPSFAVYGSKVKIEGYTNEFNAITNIGKNPTVNNSDISIETHIYNFNDDIYDKLILIKLFENIRVEKKMSSLEELKKQIIEDNKIWKKRIDEKY